MCACIGNADETAIVQACQLHAQWAREMALGAYRLHQGPPALDAYGLPRAGKSTTR